MRVYERKKGDVLQPGRFTPGVVRGLKQKSREWSGQYQQEPAPTSGVIFNPAWWRFYKTRPEFDIVALSVDCAFKSAAQNDYVCIQRWGSVGARSYLLDMTTLHLGYAATKAMIKALQQDGPRASVILIEDKANGSAIIEELRSDDFFGAAVIAIEPEGGKESRAFAASADCEAGNVYLPENVDWLAGFLRTAAAFPAVRHDDEIDAMTQFLNWRRSRSESLGFIEFLQRRAKEIVAGVCDAFGELIRKPTPKPVPVKAVARPAIARVEGYLAQKGDPPKCPLCGGPRIWMSGAVPGVLIAHCNQDSSDDGVLPPKPIAADGICWVEGCGLPLVMSGGSWRCQNHGQVPRSPAVAGGMTRGQYLERHQSGFGRFG